MKVAVLSLSGGLDSTALLIKSALSYEKIVAIGFDYGQNQRLELEMAQNNIDILKREGVDVEYTVVDLTSLSNLIESDLTKGKAPTGHHYKSKDKLMSTVVPNRNVIFSSIIYSVAQSIADKEGINVDILQGIQQGEDSMYLDCRQESIEACKKTFKISNYNSDKISYLTPFYDFTKTDILESLILDSADLGLDWTEIVKNTITSYLIDNEGRSHGKTSSDIKRIEAFINLGIKDPIQYQFSWEELVNHCNKYAN